MGVCVRARESGIYYFFFCFSLLSMLVIRSVNVRALVPAC